MVCCASESYDEVKDKKESQPDFENREVNDMFFCLLFFATMLGMLVVMGMGYSAGDPSLIYNGIDYLGRPCGKSFATADGGSAELGSMSVFVAAGGATDVTAVIYCDTSCPTEDKILCSDDEVGTYAPEGSSIGAQTATVLSAHGSSYFASSCGTASASSPQFTYCIPNRNSTLSDAAASVMDSQTWTTSFESIVNSGWVIFACIIVALVFSFVYLKLLELFAKPLTQIAIIVIGVALVVSGYMLMKHADTLKAGNPDGYDSDWSWQTSFYGSIAIFVLAGLYFLLMCFMWSRFMLAIDCMNLAGDALGSTPTLVNVPLVISLVSMGVLLWWLNTTMYLFSSGEVKSAPTPQGMPEGVLKYVELDTDMQRVFVFHLFGLFWVLAFFVAFGELVTALVTARWYFTAPAENGYRDTKGCGVMWGAGLAAKYHLGSVAAGSLLIAIIQTIRAIVEYLDHKRRQADPGNKLVQAACCCVKCCLCCLEKCMKFINRQAYIQIALTGLSFCDACQHAFALVARNIARVGAIKVVATAFLFIGKLMTAAAGGGLCFLILTNVDTYANPENETAVSNPLLVSSLVALFSYAVGSLTMNVFSTIIDAVLMCFIHDCDIHDGQAKFAGGELEAHVDRLNSAAKEKGIKHPSEPTDRERGESKAEPLART